MFNGKGGIVCLLSGVVDYMLVGGVFQRWMLACKSRTLMEMVRNRIWLDFSCIFALGGIF
jgi:hypothetical protein